MKNTLLFLLFLSACGFLFSQEPPVPAETPEEEGLSAKEIDALIDELDQEDGDKREKAAEELRNAGKQALDRILNYGLKEKVHPMTIAKLVEALGYIDAPESRAVVENLLSSNIAEIRVAAMDAADRLGDEKLIFKIMAMMGSENELVKRKAAVILGKRGYKSSVSYLGEMLSQTKYPHIQVTALEQLRNYPDMKDMVVEKVAELLNSDDPVIALEAAVTLKAFNDKRGEEFFTRQLQEKTGYFLEQSIEYAGKYKIKSAVPFLLKMLKSENWYLRYMATDALGSIRDPLALPSLKVLYEEEKVLPVRIALARVFYQYGSPELLSYLKHKVSVEKNVDIRWFLVATIGEIGGTESYEVLINTLMDSDEKIRITAVTALRKHTGQNFSYDPRGSNKGRNEAVQAWSQWLTGFKSKTR